MNNILLHELLKEYEKKRMLADHDLEYRKQALYTRIPHLKEIEKEINHISIENAKSMLLSKTVSSENANKIEKLKLEKIELLKKDGKDLSYFLPKYECSNCNDTGYIGENQVLTMCNCLKQKLFNAEYNKANVSDLKNQNFKKFNINLYSDEIDLDKYKNSISPKENMQDIYNATLNFIKNFDNLNEKNLLFSGGTGLGKTFLSNCIVSEMLKRNKTVLYQTAPVMLDTLISEMFSKNSTNAFSENLLNVNLLVIDDLGTETMNSMKFTELYKIINTRLLNQKGKSTKTIISTNLSLQELFNTYDERLVSRFVGNYNVYHFFGDDIRFKK